MRGKAIEDLKYVRAVGPAQSAVAATLYNGEAVSVSNNGIDTRHYDEINFVVDAGTFVGSATLDVSIVASNTDNPSGATLVSGAVFTQITTANDAQIHTASIKCKNYNRYMWVRANQNGDTTNFAALAILAKGDSDPAANTPVFDLNY